MKTLGSHLLSAAGLAGGSGLTLTASEAASTALNGRLQVDTMTVTKMGLITVFVADQPYLVVRTNLIQAQAGHLLRCLSMKLLSVQSQIAAFSWSAQKYIAASVRLI